MSEQYDILAEKYNILVAKFKDLKEQMETKQKQWNKRDKETKHVDDLTRQFCEEILAKDKKEMVLGKDYSWSQLSTEELVDKAAKSFRSYNKERTELMKNIMDLAETREFQIESLEDQIQQYMTGNDPGAAKNLQEIVEQAEKKQQDAKAKDKTPNKVKSAAADGKVDLIVEDDNDKMTPEEIQATAELMDINEQAKLTSQTIVTAESDEHKQQLEETRDAAITAHMVDLNKYIEKMNDTSWDIMDAIGGKGYSKQADILQYVMMSNQAGKTKLYESLRDLSAMLIILKEPLSLPLTPKCYVYKLSDIGYRLYKVHFKHNPVEAEVDKIIREHGNAAHGYGIMDVEKVLSESGKYKKIDSFNRNKPICVKDGKKYVPDVAADTGKYIEYFEYERGTNTQSDFNEKCNKMVQVTRYLNFVVPNKSVLTSKLIPQIDSWIATRDMRSLRNVKIRLSTAIALRDNNNMRGDGCWQVVYDLNKQIAPIKTVE